MQNYPSNLNSLHRFLISVFSFDENTIDGLSRHASPKKSTLRTTFVGAQVYPTYPISNIHRHFIQSYLFSKRISSYKEEAHTVLYICIWGMFCICVNWRRALYKRILLIQPLVISLNLSVLKYDFSRSLSRNVLKIKRIGEVLLLLVISLFSNPFISIRCLYSLLKTILHCSNSHLPPAYSSFKSFYIS